MGGCDDFGLFFYVPDGAAEHVSELKCPQADLDAMTVSAVVMAVAAEEALEAVAAAEAEAAAVAETVTGMSKMTMPRGDYPSNNVMYPSTTRIVFLDDIKHIALMNVFSGNGVF